MGFPSRRWEKLPGAAGPTETHFHGISYPPWLHRGEAAAHAQTLLSDCALAFALAMPSATSKVTDLMNESRSNNQKEIEQKTTFQEPVGHTDVQAAMDEFNHDRFHRAP